MGNKKMSDEQIEELNANGVEIWEAAVAADDLIGKTSEEGNTWPSLNMYCRTLDERVANSTIHRVMKHMIDPVRASADASRAAYQEAFLAGMLFERAGKKLTIVPAIDDEPDPLMRDYN